MKRCWNKEYAYGRLLDILEDYWITQPEEKRVRIDMRFEHMDGRTQDKTITWRNPRCPSEKMQLIPMSEVLTLDSVIEKLAMAYIFNTDDKTHLTPVNDEVIFHATEALKRAKNKYEARVLSPEELRDLAELPPQTPTIVWKEWRTGDGAWIVPNHILRKSVRFQDYGITWRCWTSYPTEEDLRAHPWLRGDEA